MAEPTDADDWASVETKDDFLRLLALLSEDWEEGEVVRRNRAARGLWASDVGDWAQGTPGAWMEAMHAWLTAWSRGDGAAEQQAAFDSLMAEPSWKTFAFILSASRRYE